MLLSISNSIKKRRKELKLTQPYLAELAEVNLNTINRIETGHANPTFEVLEKIVDVLGMEMTLTVKKPKHLTDENR